MKKQDQYLVEFSLFLVLTLLLVCWRVAFAGDPTLDLPVKPVKLGDELPNYTPQPDPPVEDDPRDTPPPTIYGEDIGLEGDVLVYVIDRSGSMGLGRSPTRLDKAKEALSKSVSSLPDTFRFEIWIYSSYMRRCFGKEAEASPVNKAAAIKWLRKWPAGGATATGETMAAALQAHPSCQSFVLLTDGIPNHGTQFARDMIRANNLQGAAIDCFGIEAIGEFRAFLQGVASDSGGRYFDVP